MLMTENQDKVLLTPASEVLKVVLESELLGFPTGAVVGNPPANAGDMGSNPGPGRSHMPQSN